jgi:S-formylglutathione hydrolase FrmB
MRAARPTRPAAATVLLVLALVTACSTAAAPAVPGRAPAEAARIVSTTTLTPRIRDLVIDSPAVGPHVSVRLLLPRDYDTRPDRRWPVLYLLHGCCDGYRAWTRSTDLEALTADADVLVVMPDGGTVGFYSDWRSGPRWETFHLVELWDLLRADFRAGDRRAVAGLSMGGLGALGYAARHPGMFTAAASFSGIAHTRLDDREPQHYVDLVRAYGEDPRALWGDPVADRDTWAAHNPFDLASRLAGTRLYVSCGDGRPGPFDGPATPVDDREAALGRENAALVGELARRGVPAEVDLYGPGTHSWPYWQRALHRAWPLLTAGLDAP